LERGKNRRNDRPENLVKARPIVYREKTQEAAEILEFWRLLENVQMQGARNPEESALKGGIFERRTSTYVAVTCPVESAVPSREARIQQGEDDAIPPKAGKMGVFQQSPRMR
jgi:hypothetical protein